jgi:hypothetical protein
VIHHVPQFLGLAGYYRRFIKRFSDIVAPLSNLLKVEETVAKKQQKSVHLAEYKMPALV